MKRWMLAFLIVPLAALLGMGGQSIPMGALPASTAVASYLYLGLGCYNSPTNVCSSGTSPQGFGGYARAEYIASGSHAAGYSVVSCLVYLSAVDASPNNLYRCAIYSSSTFDLITNCAQTTDQVGVVGWNTSPMPAGCTLAASSSYYIFVEANGSGTLDSVSTVYPDGYSYVALTYGAWPSSLTGAAGSGSGYAFALQLSPL